MKVLLLGELSGVHRELRPGLERAGVTVTAAHSRLAYPDFASDVDFYRPPSGETRYWTILRDIASQVIHAPELTGFDIVQMMTPKFFNWKIHSPLMRYLKKHNGALVVINTSCSSDYHRRASELKYSPCIDCKRYDQKSISCVYDMPDEQAAEHLSWELADAIVSTHFEYDWGLRDTKFSEKLSIIGLPVDIARHPFAPMPSGDRLRIWYGETRFGFKGGRSIKNAIERVQTAFGSRVEVVQSGRLAFEDYLQFLTSVHIVVDQANSYGPGMNALYAMSRGRVVLTGAEEVEGGSLHNPAINITPDPDQIEAALIELIANAALLPEIGRRSADYVIAEHSADVIAAKYCELYRGLVAA